ncbi:MAG: TetR/AcrR family transcriptional regulator [Bauldia litoralis]|uniref:TetR/AcrR family transcriptional regulator n=2 Tax=Bauldia litoralis TaxID=665467 RepID=UPI00329A4765
MFIEMIKRRYIQKQRAESRGETRQKIIEATAAIHEEFGPRQSTISAIAERAGVQRLTVYRHFPDEGVLFEACTAHWLERHPPPGPETWAGESGSARVRTALASLYAYYRATRRMWTVSYRDVEDVPALQGPMKAFGAYLESIVADLLTAVDASGSDPRAGATLGAAVQFATWRALDGQGLDDDAKASLVGDWLAGIVSR